MKWFKKQLIYMGVIKMINEILEDLIPYWRCPVHKRKLTELPLPDDYKGPRSHLKVYFCEDCKKGYSILDLLSGLICKR